MLIVVDQNLCDAAVNLGSDRGDVPVHLGVIGGFAVVEVQVQAQQDRKQGGTANDQARANLRGGLFLRAEIQFLCLRLGNFHLCRVL